MDEWKTIGRPGYFGKRRDELYRGWDERWGKGNWRVAWQVGEVVADYLGACALYEDAYFAFMTAHPDVTAQLVREACDVYDDAPSNVHSRFDYAKQETSRTHIQDIAIRRSLLRMGIWFKGTELIRIRDHEGTHPLSMTLSPGQVPFHRPDLVFFPPPDRADHAKWFRNESVEAFYQHNKLLQAKA